MPTYSVVLTRVPRWGNARGSGSGQFTALHPGAPDNRQDYDEYGLRRNRTTANADYGEGPNRRPSTVLERKCRDDLARKVTFAGAAQPIRPQLVHRGSVALDAHELHVFVLPEARDSARRDANDEGIALFRVRCHDGLKTFTIVDELDRPFDSAQVLGQCEQRLVRPRMPFAVA